MLDGLKVAAGMCRDREHGWRTMAAVGGTDMHPVSICMNRAYEAMTCAEEIEMVIAKHEKGEG